MDDKENVTLTELKDSPESMSSGQWNYDPYADVYHGTSLNTDSLLSGGYVDTITITGAGTGYTYTGANTGLYANTIGTLWSDEINSSAKISLKGEDADIEVNGESLMGMIKNIQESLNILCPDPRMEAEWDELRELREKYDAKLAECREKSRMWKTLQQMPPPVIK